MRVQVFTVVYAIVLVFCFTAPKVLSATNSFFDKAWLLNYDLGEEESEEETQKEKSEAEFYVHNAPPSLTTLPFSTEVPSARLSLIDSLFYPEVFAPPPEGS